MSDTAPPASARPDLPSPAQARRLAGWLAGPRSRALRRVAIGRRQHILEVGTGHGLITPELQRRAAGPVICLDNRASAVPLARVADAPLIAGDCCHLPFPAKSFDLVFFQNVLLWVSGVESALREASRVLQPDGAVVAIEPDFGGMMEYPDRGLKQLWVNGLRRAGGDPYVGRKLPAACEAAGLKTWVELTHLPQPAQVEAVLLLEDLPLTTAERQVVQSAAQQVAHQQQSWQTFLHVPYFLVVGTKPE